MSAMTMNFNDPTMIQELSVDEMDDVDGAGILRKALGITFSGLGGLLGTGAGSVLGPGTAIAGGFIGGGIGSELADHFANYAGLD